jgi:putative hydrolase of the HAD superfamily
MTQGLLFDYGGTIDTNGLHWGSVLWAQYEKNHVPVSKADFSKAYAFGERALAINPLVKPEHNFYDVLCLKTEQQFNFLEENGFSLDRNLIETIATDSNAFARCTIEKALPTLEMLVEKYPLVMVSNFYGNLNSVLKDFGIRSYFKELVESAVVGVRKPDAAIYQLGVEALNIPAENCIVIGDSYSKDIVPAHSIGCKTIWLNVQGWEDTTKSEDNISVADSEITDFKEVTKQIELLFSSQRQLN